MQISNLTDPLNSGGTYQTATTKIDISGIPDLTTVSSVSGGGLTVTLSDTMTKGSVPSTFTTWGSPPDTESSTPPILNTFNNPNVNTRTLSFSENLSVFGVEVEPGAFGLHTMTMEFFEGAVLVGSVSRSVDGNAGARILAGESTTPFDSVVITESTPDPDDESFAIAQLRFQTAPAAVPEPATLTLLGLGALSLMGYARRRKVVV
jgi:hypothetical protein